MTISQGVRVDILIQSLLTNILILVDRQTCVKSTDFFLEISTFSVHNTLMHVTHGDRKEHSIVLCVFSRVSRSIASCLDQIENSRTESDTKLFEIQ